MDLRKERTKTEGCKFCWMLPSLVASVDVTEFQKRDELKLRSNWHKISYVHTFKGREYEDYTAN
jgi:hypothetical protein